MGDQHNQLLLGSYSIASNQQFSDLSAGRGDVGDINHTSILSDNFGSIFMQEEYADVVIIIDSYRIPAHRVILASRSEYFSYRALLFGGMRESGQMEIELRDSLNICAFKILLRYIYTGCILLNHLKEDLTLDVLGLAHCYGFGDLETAISDFLKAEMIVGNLCNVYGQAHAYALNSLIDYCLEFADKHASEILQSSGFSQLAPLAVKQLISRDSFCAPEVDIFLAVKEWVARNPDENKTDIISEIRLPLLSLDDLFKLVRPSLLISENRLLDSIEEKTRTPDRDLRYRGALVVNVNVATPHLGAQVIEGELKTFLLNGDSTNYDMERGFSRHPIEPGTEGIVVKLGCPYIINHIRLLLWDRDNRQYGYTVEVSVNHRDWFCVADYSKYYCRSWQQIHFFPRVARYIRVIGTHNTSNNVFHLVSLEAYHKSSVPAVVDGLIVPDENVATTVLSATVLEGVSRCKNALLNGEFDKYDWDSGYTCHQLKSGSIVIELAQPYLIDSFRLLLWDCDERSYSFYVEISMDKTTWTRVVDRSDQPCRSWQSAFFERRAVTFIRIVGTHNTANEVFHCVHFECPAQMHSGESVVFQENRVQDISIEVEEVS